MYKIIILSLIVLSTTPSFAFSEKEFQVLKDKVEELEFKSYENYTRVGGTIENSFMNYKREDKKATSANDKFKRFNRFMTAADIDIAAIPTSDLSAYLRVSMKKFWNRQTVTPVPGSGDGTKNGTNSFGDFRVSPGSSLMYLARAFIKYEFIPTWTFSVGRLPTVGGSPKEYLTGGAEGAAYHTLAMSAAMDGAAIAKTYRFANDSTLGARFAYTPWSYYNSDHLVIEDHVEASDTSGVKVKPNNTAYTFIVDYKTSKLNFAKNAKFLYQLFAWDEVFIGAPTTSSLRVSVVKHIFAFDFKNLFKSKFDFNIAYANIKTKSKGSFSGLGGVLCVSTNIQSCKVKGDIITFVTKYNFTSKLALGYQYFKQDSTAFAFDTDAMGHNFFSTPGSTSHRLFTYYKFNDFLTTSIGYLKTKVKSKAPVIDLIGERSTVDRKTSGIDIRLIAKF